MPAEKNLDVQARPEKKRAVAGRRRTPAPVAIADDESGSGEASEVGSAPAILCKAALDLFASRNFSTVTIKDIAEATGFNASLIYYYFGNKEGLFTRAIELTVEDAFKHFRDISRNAKRPDKIINLWIELHVRQFVTLQKVAKMSLDYANTQNFNPAVDRAIKAFYDKEAKLLVAAIQRGVAEGMFRPVNPGETAVLISTFLDGALFRNAMFPDFNYTQAIRAMRKIIMMHLTVGADALPA